MIVQSDPFNESRISTVIIAILTSNLRPAAAPGNILLGRRESKLPEDSVINVSQVLTVDKSLLTERVGRLSAQTVVTLDAGLSLVLGL